MTLPKGSKARDYVAGRIVGKSKKQAALDAGYAPSVAEKPGAKIESTDGVQRCFTAVLEAAGISDERLAERLNEGLDAIETKVHTHAGLPVSQTNLISFSERREYAELICKLKGHFVERHEHGVSRTLEEILEATCQLEEQGEG